MTDTKKIPKAKMNSNKKKGQDLNNKIKNMLCLIKKEDIVFILTDKTNSYKTMRMTEYIEEVTKHLTKGAFPSNRNKIVHIYEEGKLLLLNLSNVLNENKHEHILETIETKAIPTPKLLIPQEKQLKRKFSNTGSLQIHRGISKNWVQGYQEDF